MSCACVEFVFAGTGRCAECGCKSSKHKNMMEYEYDQTKEMPLTNRSHSQKRRYMNKVSNASKMTNSRTERLLESQRRIFCIWLITSIVWAYTSFGNANPIKTMRFFTPYLYAASVFFIGVFFAAMGYGVAKNQEKRMLSEVLIIVNLIAMGSYLIMYFGLTPILRDVNGYPVQFAKILEWVATCPALIALTSSLTRDSNGAGTAISYDYLLLVCGFFGSILKSPHTYFALLIAVGSFYKVISYLWNILTDSIEGKTLCRLDKLSLKVVRAITVYSWAFFPVIFFSVRFQAMSYSTGEMLFLIADILSKVFVTMLLINASVEELQNNKVDILVGIAEEMSVDLDKTEGLLSRMMPEQ